MPGGARARAPVLAPEFGRWKKLRIILIRTASGAIDDDGRWLYRLVGVWRQSDTQVDFVSEDALVFAPSLSFRPDDDTTVTLLAN